MNITTITLIVAGVALALGIQVILLHIFGMRKISASLKDIKAEIETAHTEPLQMLVDKYDPRGDFEEDDEDDSTVQPAQVVITQFVDTPNPSGKPAPNEEALQMAYRVFTPQYEALCQDLDEHNYKERAPQMVRLLIEMGLWLKDFLPVSQNDFNATRAQRENVNSIGLPDDQRAQRIADAPAPSGNAYNTPVEVIALNNILQEWGVDDLQLLLSGYQYKKNQKQE